MLPRLKWLREIPGDPALMRDLQALLGSVEPAQVAEQRPRAVPTLASVFALRSSSAQLGGHLQRLGADADRLLLLAVGHQERGEAGPHVRLRRRGLRRPRAAAVARRNPARRHVAAALHPGHVGERGVRLGGRLVRAGREQRVAGLLHELGPTALRADQRPPVASRSSWPLESSSGQSSTAPA